MCVVESVLSTVIPDGGVITFGVSLTRGLSIFFLLDLG